VRDRLLLRALLLYLGGILIFIFILLRLRVCIALSQLQCFLPLICRFFSYYSVMRDKETALPLIRILKALGGRLAAYALLQTRNLDIPSRSEICRQM
jgi:hypothetical protein